MRRRCVPAFALFASMPALCAQAPVAVELRVEDDERAFVHGVVEATIRVSIAREFLEQRLVQLFARPVELPVQLSVPWWAGQAGLEALGPTDADAVASLRQPGEVHLVLGDRLAIARTLGDRERDGVTCAEFELSRRFVVTRAGRMQLAAPRLRYAYATRFVVDVISGRMPADRSEDTVEGQDVDFMVAALPEAGRPADFSGAVGSFVIEASAALAEVQVGQHFTLELRIRGEGDLARFAAPRLDRLVDFDAFGSASEVDGRTRVIRYDLAAHSAGAREIPAIEFSFFDDRADPPAYRRVASEPIALRVLASADGAPTRTEVVVPRVPGVDDVHDIVSAERLRATSSASAATLSRLGAVVSLSLPWLLALSLCGLVWARRRRRQEPATVWARAALARFEQNSAHSGDPFADFVEFLAARLGCPPSAVVGPDLAARLAAAGAGERSIAACVAVIGQADAARYANSTIAPGVDRSELRALAAVFDRELTLPKSRRS